jgi:hypothetical protein
MNKLSLLFIEKVSSDPFFFEKQSWIVPAANFLMRTAPKVFSLAKGGAGLALRGGVAGTKAVANLGAKGILTAAKHPIKTLSTVPLLGYGQEHIIKPYIEKSLQSPMISQIKTPTVEKYLSELG